MQQWSAVEPDARRQLWVGGSLWNPAVRYSADMANPAELCFDDERFCSRHPTFLQHLCIGYLILPFNRSYSVQATHMKLIETADMTSIGDPRLAAVQQGGDDYSFVE